MRLEIGTFPVKEVKFGASTRWQDGLLEINGKELAESIMRDPRIATARIELAKPGESVRIWPVRDVIEPRIKVKGPGVVYPGMCDRPVTTVGQGVTHRLSGVGVVEVSEVQQHDAGGDYTEVYVDMSGPWAGLIPYASLLNVCVVVEPDPALHVDTRNRAVHQASLAVSDALASTVKGLDPPHREVFELKPVSPSLPRVVYIPCVHSPQAMSGSLSTFCISIYGLSQLTSPWVLHPNEILDGAISGPYRTPFATSWTAVNNPVLMEMYRRHGVDFNFTACIVLRTEWTTQNEKDLISQQTAKVASLFGAQGALITWDAGGNEFMEVIRTVQACERLGIKTVFLTSEDLSSEGVSTMLEPVPEADAMVSTGFFPSMALGLGELPPVERVIGSVAKVAGELRDQTVPTAGKLAPPRRYDDHYGFNKLTCVES
jgi:hypothetical protein